MFPSTQKKATQVLRTMRFRLLFCIMLLNTLIPGLGNGEIKETTPQVL